MAAKKRGLGRGLDALLTTSQQAASRRHQEEDATAELVPGELRKLPLEQLHPGRYQPRKDMSPEALEELANSVKAQGIIQPVVVRQTGPEQFEIIAGERRWRAAQLAQLSEIPCLVKDIPDEAAIAMALIENIQREDLNALEEATALQRLMTEFEMTQQAVAEAVGKSRTTVTNLLRLMQLNDDVKLLLERGDIETGHAKVLLGVNGDLQSELARTIAAKALTVREAERLIQKALKPAADKAQRKPDPDIVKLEQSLSESLGAKVAISYNRKGKGKLVINYANLDELDGILNRIQ